MTTDDSYETILALLEQKRDDLTGVINALRSVMDLAPQGGNVDSDSARGAGNGAKLRDDEFFGMSIPAASMKLLAAVKKPLTAPDVAQELQDHGLINDSPNFTNSVYSALHREQSRGNVLQTTGKRWGLAEWYPKGARKAKGSSDEENEGSEPTDEDEPSEPEQPS